MVDKLHEYQGLVGRLHTWREQAREWRALRSSEGISLFSRKPQPQDVLQDKREDQEDYSHTYRKKTRAELVRVSATVMGIEFAYAAETAFVSPTLLKIGVQHEHMTLVWALSPLIGFFVTPLLGSLSDRCRLRWGRRRPFIVLLAVGVFIGLILVPNGEDIGHALGDFYPSRDLPKPTVTNTSMSPPSASVGPEEGLNVEPEVLADSEYSHPWGVFFTILGTALLDFDADACQSPARAYLLDVTIPEDHARGLSTFTVMAGLGGFLGYALGGINWDATALGVLLGGHVRAVFTLITVIFVVCVSYTITSFKEIPLAVIEQGRKDTQNGVFTRILDETENSYGTLTPNNHDTTTTNDDSKECRSIRESTPGYVNHGYDETYPQPVTRETSFIDAPIPVR